MLATSYATRKEHREDVDRLVQEAIDAGVSDEILYSGFIRAYTYLV